MNKCLNNLSLEGARIIYRNFRGQATQYNREGSRNFCVVLDDPELGRRMGEAGLVRAREHFSWQAIGVKTAELYRSLV